MSDLDMLGGFKRGEFIVFGGQFPFIDRGCLAKISPLWKYSLNDSPLPTHWVTLEQSPGDIMDTYNRVVHGTR